MTVGRATGAGGRCRYAGEAAVVAGGASGRSRVVVAGVAGTGGAGVVAVGRRGTVYALGGGSSRAGGAGVVAVGAVADVGVVGAGGAVAVVDDVAVAIVIPDPLTGEVIIVATQVASSAVVVV